MEFFRNTQIDFMRWRRICFGMSMILLAVVLISDFARKSLNLGIDFVGGTQLTVKFAEVPSIEDVRSLMEANGIEDSVIQQFGEASENSLLIKTPLIEGAEEGSRSQIVSVLETRFPDGEATGAFEVLGAENVGPQIGSELRRSSLLALTWALLGMLGYIWLRFELRFGIGALVAVVHDVMITLGLFAAAGYEFNLTTIAGFLTLVGYSVNDSVVVFDRVRENLRQNRRLTLVEVMNQSLNQTLSRTVLTSGTTLIAVGCLLFLGGDVLRGFAFIICVGVLIGTYSSIYIACPIALLWERWFGREARSRRRAA